MVKGRRIDVDVRQGVATLRGDVASEGERAQALRLARTADGVQRVEDALTVNASLGAPAIASSGKPSTPPALDNVERKPSPGAQNDDAVLTSTLQSKLLPSINVSAKDGVVLLEGTVPNQAAKQRALSIARQTKGVTQVVDRLTVGKKQ
jgi:osmotically-inducible protein OsmY